MSPSTGLKIGTMRTLLALVCGVTALSLLSSCTLPRRKSLQVTTFSQTAPAVPRKQVVVSFEQAVPGKPLNETVWDNISGPFWDVKESKQIGFNQHYQPQFYAIPPASVSTVKVDTRIVIPFGNIFSTVVGSAARAHFAEAEVCYDANCVQRAEGKPLLSVKIEKFAVWEAPLNHLNFYAKGRSSYRENGTAKNYEFEKSMLQQKLGSVLSTHNKMIGEMSKLANQFADELTAEIFKNGL